MPLILVLDCISCHDHPLTSPYRDTQTRLIYFARCYFKDCRGLVICFVNGIYSSCVQYAQLHINLRPMA